MTDHAHDHATVETRLWDAVEKQRTGMLGLAADGRHVQPMTAFLDREARQIWFFTYDDTDLAQAIAEAPADGVFVFQQDDLQACVAGRLALSRDRRKMDAYWNPVVAAWYPDGKDDPRLTLLRLDCEDAQVWLTEAGPVRFAFEVAKANVTGARPDLGAQRGLDFH